MGVEIERKFLVQGQGWRCDAPERLIQGYLSREPARTVRLRLAGESAWLTIKGRSQGLSRAEFEYPIPPDDAREMLALCDGPLIDKWRHRVVHAGMLWEIDEFLGDNLGLVVAEIELPSAAHAFEPPPWLATEVSEEPRYFNSALSQRPYRSW